MVTIFCNSYIMFRLYIVANLNGNYVNELVGTIINVKKLNRKQNSKQHNIIKNIG